MILERLESFRSLEGLESVEGLERLERLECRYWALGSFFDFRPKKYLETQKQDWKKTYLFLVTDRLDRYLALRPIHLNLIIYITLSSIFNKLH